MKTMKGWVFKSFFDKRNKNNEFHLWKIRPVYTGVVRVEIRPKPRRRKK